MADKGIGPQTCLVSCGVPMSSGEWLISNGYSSCRGQFKEVKQRFLPVTLTVAPLLFPSFPTIRFWMRPSFQKLWEGPPRGQLPHHPLRLWVFHEISLDVYGSLSALQGIHSSISSRSGWGCCWDASFSSLVGLNQCQNLHLLGHTNN